MAVLDRVTELINKNITGDQKLSICMIVKDEEANIGPCIEAFKECADEFCIVDTGSTDRTLEIIETNRISGLEIQVEQHVWEPNFSKFRNISLEMASHSWILWIDADDRADKQTIQKLNAIKKTGLTKRKAYLLPIINYVKGKPNQKFAQLRVFPNSHGIKFEGKIHENVNASLEKHDFKTYVLSDAPIKHLGYDVSPEILKEKRQRNYEILMTELDNTSTYYYLGGYYRSMQNPYYAMSCYTQVLIRDNVSKAMREKSKLMIGECFESLSIYDKAIEWYSNSEDSDANFRIAECYLLQGNVLEAKIHYEMYINEPSGVSYMGDNRETYEALAYAQLISLSEKEFQHWTGEHADFMFSKNK
jgi:glycosyltransferase involved in cell wall biosynthesis